MSSNVQLDLQDDNQYRYTNRATFEGVNLMKQSLQMGIEINAQSGSVLKPHQIQFWNLQTETAPTRLKQAAQNPPLKYFTDAILGLCFQKMTQFKYLEKNEKTFAETAYRSLDTYSELYFKSAPRIKSLRKNHVNNKDQPYYEKFEQQLSDVLKLAFSKQSLVLKDFNAVLDCIQNFEQQLSTAFLYNVNIQFSQQFTESLICFYSLLFHLRALIAVDHNSHVDDSAFECVKCDSISDYLPKSDYTVNDAILYLQFKKLSVPFVGHKDKDTRIEKLFVEPMTRHFNQYNHNACCLIDQLPASFINGLSQNELEEALHHVQMDWLLGSESGLLFKIREELYGVIEGYEKIFWPEASTAPRKKPTHLDMCFRLTEKDLSKGLADAS